MAGVHKPIAYLLTGIALAVVGGCGFLPGFAVFEQPLLYHIPVGQVATQVSCELQSVLSDYTDYENHYHADVDPDDPNQLSPPRWYISSDNVPVTLTLNTDNSGDVAFTGVNLSELDKTISQFITSQTSGGVSVPSLQAKLTPTRTNKATIVFSVSPTAFQSENLVLNSYAPQSTQPYLQINTASGGSPRNSKLHYIFRVIGKPVGMTFLQGTPDVNSMEVVGSPKPGQFAYIVQVVDNYGNEQHPLVTGTIGATPATNALVLTATPAARIIKGQPYSQLSTVEGGTGSYHFNIVGRPPAGTTFNPSSPDAASATISGSPTTEDELFVYIIEVSDDAGHTQSSIVSGQVRRDGYQSASYGPCPDWALQPDHNLFLKTWLRNFFDKVNTVTQQTEKTYLRNPLCDLNLPGSQFDATGRYTMLGNPCLPDGTSFSSVELSTSFKVALDVSAGLSPEAFGGSVFLLPVNGVSGDLNGDYSDTIDIKLTLCDNDKGGCSSAKNFGALDVISRLTADQCHAYAVLSPISSTSITQPKDVLEYDSQKQGPTAIVLTCSKALGCYVPKDKITQAKKCLNLTIPD